MTPPAAADPAASAARDPGSFRDPSGFVFWLDGRPYRQIQQRFATDGTRSPERPRSTADRTGTAPPLRTSIPRSRPGARRPCGDRARADRVHQLPVRVDVRGAAGRGAPDARRSSSTRSPQDGRSGTPRAYNVQFLGGRPVLIDSLSFEPARGRHAVGRVPPVLRALPGAACAHGPARCAPGGLLRDQLDGVPLDLAASLLPRRSRLNFGPACPMSTCMPDPSARTPASRSDRRRARRRASA